MVSKLLESDKLCLFLLLDGTLIDDNKYLESLETASELIVCTRGLFCMSLLKNLL